jgi:hypothetical protein
VVVGFLSEFAGGGDVVLGALDGSVGEWWTYVDAPELFDRVKGDDFFEEIVPVVTLSRFD